VQGLGRREREAHPQHRLDVLNGEGLILSPTATGFQQQSTCKCNFQHFIDLQL
jgi:hypothetical protein